MCCCVCGYLYPQSTGRVGIKCPFLMEGNRVLLLWFEPWKGNDRLYPWRWLTPDNDCFLAPDLGKEQADTSWSLNCPKWISLSESPQGSSEPFLGGSWVPSPPLMTLHMLTRLNPIANLQINVVPPVHRWGNNLGLWELNSPGVRQLVRGIRI